MFEKGVYIMYLLLVFQLQVSVLLELLTLTLTLSLGPILAPELFANISPTPLLSLNSRLVLTYLRAL